MWEKAHLMCQVGIGKIIAVDVSKDTRLTSKSGRVNSPERSLAGARLLARWCPACRRGESDQAAFAWNVRRRAPTLLPLVGGERECSKRLKP
jgi:hypothetical protein